MYKPIIPLFLRSLAENREEKGSREGDRKRKGTGKKSLFRDPLSDVANHRVAAAPRPQSLRTIEFPLPPRARRTTLYATGSISRPIFRQNGKGNRDSCRRWEGRAVSFRRTFVVFRSSRASGVLPSNTSANNIFPLYRGILPPIDLTTHPEERRSIARSFPLDDNYFVRIELRRSNSIRDARRVQAERQKRHERSYINIDEIRRLECLESKAGSREGKKKISNGTRNSPIIR